MKLKFGLRSGTKLGSFGTKSGGSVASFALPFADDFNRANGAIGGFWTGSTWTIVGNAALNTPTLGSELLANPGFEGTYENEGVGLDVAPNWNQLSCEAGDVLGESADAHSGSKSQSVNVDAANEGVISAASSIPGNKWTQLSGWLKRTSPGDVYMMDAAGTLVYFISPTASWVQYLITGRSNVSARQFQFMSAGAAANFLVDDASVKEITPASMFATVPDVGVASVTAQVVVTVSPDRTQAGLIINLDSTSNPQNFVLAVLDGTTSSVPAKLIKCVAGVYTDVISGAVTYGAAKILKVVKSGNTYQLFYDGVQVGTDQTVASMNGTIHGLFASHPTAKFDNYQLAATP